MRGKENNLKLTEVIVGYAEGSEMKNDDEIGGDSSGDRIQSPLKRRSTESGDHAHPHDTNYEESSHRIDPQIRSPKKACNCDRSNCLKLYCECFKASLMCLDCNCRNCHNNTLFEKQRSKAINAILSKNKDAFKSRISGVAKSRTELQHRVGCHCSRSNCLKGYCECFQNKVLCGAHCKCIHCYNKSEKSLKDPQNSVSYILDFGAGVPHHERNISDIAQAAAVELDKIRSSSRASEQSVTPDAGLDDVILHMANVLVETAVESERSNDEAETIEKVLTKFEWCLQQIKHQLQ